MPNDKNSKRFIAVAIATPIALATILFGFIYIYDPLQIFHKSFFGKPRFFGEMRLGARGIIEHYDYDSYIIGTSMLQNTSAKEANQKISGNFVNISPAASSIAERAIILNFLFKHKKPKNIIYSLDAFTDEMRGKINFKLLYDDSKLNDLEAYLNDRFLICILTLSKDEKCVGKPDIETALQWYREEKHQQRLGGFANWIKYNPDELKKFDLFNLKPVIFDDNLMDITKQKKFLSQFTLPFIKDNSQTKFYLILPPYSRFHFRVFPSAFMERKKVVLWLLEQIRDLDNVKIYAFDDLDYPDDIANYAGDTIHYAQDMNSLELSAIKDKRHILTLDNAKSYFDKVEQKIKSYDVEPFIDMIKNL
ncbi:hypothetical protein V2I28_00310 [Campylobacter sp. CX2-4080-23]|uniref:hypothetical protein n=1 Tax=Campylobacter porcelli TaxID=1660073 RepID=UPI002EA71E1F|nr:hypothetical protein [Campylobacter sp. CX2-4080-23]